MSGLTQTEIVSRLRKSGDLSDEDVAILVAAFIQRHTEQDVTDMSVASGMLMFTGRRITTERAEHLLAILAERGFIEEEG